MHHNVRWNNDETGCANLKAANMNQFTREDASNSARNILPVELEMRAFFEPLRRWCRKEGGGAIGMKSRRETTVLVRLAVEISIRETLLDSGWPNYLT